MYFSEYSLTTENVILYSRHSEMTNIEQTCVGYGYCVGYG